MTISYFCCMLLPNQIVSSLKKCMYFGCLWASLVAQMVIFQQCGRPGFDLWVGRFPGRGHGNLAWRIPMDRGTWRATSLWGREESDTTKRLSTAHISVNVFWPSKWVIINLSETVHIQMYFYSLIINTAFKFPSLQLLQPRYSDYIFWLCQNISSIIWRRIRLC